MKICLFTDNHFCQYSSIVRKRGTKYSLRLENQIKSLNWVERLAEEHDCKAIFSLGDFFDSASLNAEELTALQEIKWSDIRHIFIVGNHEAGLSNLSFSSSHVLNLKNKCSIIDTPQMFKFSNAEVCVLPYINEQNRETLSYYFGDKKPGINRVILSHNDVKGIYCDLISRSGFEIDDIKSNCDLFINGHLHNSGYMDAFKKILNLGNLTGQNFNEDAFYFSHFAMILDLSTLEYKLVENPHAFNFYKLDFTAKNDIDYINDISSKLKNNSILSIKCDPSRDNTCILARFVPDYQHNLFPKLSNVLETRVTYEQKVTEKISDDFERISNTDYMLKFRNISISELGDSESLHKELDILSGINV